MKWIILLGLLFLSGCCTDCLFSINQTDYNVYEMDNFTFKIERTDYAENLSMNMSKDLCEVESKYIEDRLCYKCIDERYSIAPGLVGRGDWVCPV